MGEIEVRGPEAEVFLDYLLPKTIAGLTPGRVIYSPLCNEQGGVIDDLLVYKRGEGDFLLVVNASRRGIDIEWIGRQAKRKDKVTVEDASDLYGMTAIQGPAVEKVVQHHAEIDVREVGYYRFTEGRICGVDALVSRTGYTGEDGFEILCKGSAVGQVWDRFVEEEHVVPCGLGARDTLRLEMGYPLYGHELTEEMTPVEAGLGWTVDFEKEGFIGKDALVSRKRRGVQQKLVGLVVEERAIPRQDQPVLSEKGEKIGYITSGTFSPSLKQGIALSYIRIGYETLETRVSVEIREKVVTARVIKPPFVTPHVKHPPRRL
jgi:aminomethyltransferase